MGKKIPVRQIMPYIPHINAWKREIGDSDVHFHNSFEIVLVTGGEGVQILNGTAYPMSRGWITLLTYNDFHSIKAGKGLEVINIMFNENLVSKDLLDFLVIHSENLCFPLDDPATQRAVHLAQVLMGENDYDDDYRISITSNILNCLIMMILRRGKTVRTDSDVSPSAIDTAIRYLYIHFTENPPVKKMSELSGYTPNYFCHLFYERTGKHYTEFLNALKINLAKRLLSTTEKTSTQIAFSCGFTSLTNFYRTFKKTTEMSPADYRETLRQRKRS